MGAWGFRTPPARQVLSPPSHLESCKRQDLKFSTYRNRGTSPSWEASEPSRESREAPSTPLGETRGRSCIHSPRRECCRSIKSFCLSHRTHFLSSSCLAARGLPVGAGAQVHSLVHAGEEWGGGNGPSKALQTAPIGLFLRYLKQAEISATSLQRRLPHTFHRLELHP